MGGSTTMTTCIDKLALPMLPTEAYVDNRTQEQIAEVIPWVHDSPFVRGDRQLTSQCAGN
jgi:hypothetical protein